jgi:hypothetical protein
VVEWVTETSLPESEAERLFLEGESNPILDGTGVAATLAIPPISGIFDTG